MSASDHEIHDRLRLAGGPRVVFHSNGVSPMYRTVFLLLAVATASVPAAASDVGIGVPISVDDRRIYLPIWLSDDLRLEPVVSYRRIKNSFEAFDETGTEIALQLGAFRTVATAEHLSCYAGGRVGYTWEKLDEKEDGVSTRGKNDGYSIAPTFGCEHSLSKHLSIAGEVDVSYSHQSGDIPFREEQTAVGTGSRLILRFMP